MNMDCKVLFALTLLASLGCRSAGKLIMKPRHTDIKINHTTYFNCSTDIAFWDIFWFHGKNYVYTGYVLLEPYHERFAIDRSELTGTYIYNLVIRSVQPSDAGEYICIDDEGFGEQYAAQLVVLEDDPVCRSNREPDEVIGQNSCNVEPEKVELECSVAYHGNIPPQMEWRKVGENSSAPLDVSVVTSGNQLVSTLKLTGGIALNNSSYVCETQRTSQETYKCTSQVMKIVYALSNNSTLNAPINDEIQCKANTSQTCSYKWKWLQDNNFTIESTSSVLKATKVGWHRCDAECYLRNQTCNLLVMRAFIHGEAVSSQLSWHTMIVVISVLATLVVVGAVTSTVCWILRSRGINRPAVNQRNAEEHGELPLVGFSECEGNLRGNSPPGNSKDSTLNNNATRQTMPNNAKCQQCQTSRKY